MGAMSLEDLPDPPDTEAGWKLDPTGVGDWRWWNGEKWVAEVAGSPSGKPTFWSRLGDLPLWAKFGLPLATVLIVLLEIARYKSDAPFDAIWWFLPL